jgi:hypothetical protein
MRLRLDRKRDNVTKHPAKRRSGHRHQLLSMSARVTLASYSRRASGISAEIGVHANGAEK